MNEVREQTPWGPLEGGQRQAEGPAKALNCRHAWRCEGQQEVGAGAERARPGVMEPVVREEPGQAFLLRVWIHST